MAVQLQHEAMAEVHADKYNGWEKACKEFEQVARDVRDVELG